VGGTRQPAEVPNPALREYEAYGLPLVSPGAGVARLAEACTIIRRLWTGEVFDFAGEHDQLKQAVCQPPPVQHPGPPLLLAGRGNRTLAVIAEHADVWNIPGPPHNPIEYLIERSRRLDETCEAIWRDPANLERSTQIVISYDDPAATRATIAELAANGFSHFVLPMPYAPGAAAVARRRDHPAVAGSR
jgi:alkanesulfonate monooxygenase SsuD/methylene tetrahydromethanopterin reductase-like flavin-dependent oxidoreductase (luciferase family)